MSNKEELASSDSSVTTKRLFFALWPDEEVIQNINKHAVKHFLNCQGRILDNKNWHITLAYFGASDTNTQACLEMQAEKIKSQPFELNLSKCGFWPRPKVAWLAPGIIPQQLKQLATEVQNSIKHCGYMLETRPYQPHVTLVRKAKHPPFKSEVKPIPWHVEQFCLVESQTYQDGAQYRVLKTWDF